MSVHEGELMPAVQQEADTAARALDVPALADDQLVEVARKAEARIEAMTKIKRAAIRITNAGDWLDQQGRPYLQVSGAEKIARLFGVSWRIEEPVLERYDDGHFSYTYRGVFSLGSASIQAIGARSSRDPFFSRKHGKDVPPSEIDPNDVKKAAYTNLLGNGIMRLLGLRNLSWDDLHSAGIGQGSVSRVEYQTQEMSPEAQQQRDEIRRMILEMVGGDQEQAKAKLVEFTSFVGKDGRTVLGKPHVNQLSEKMIPVTYGKVKRAYEEWQKGGAGNGAASYEQPGFFPA